MQLLRHPVTIHLALISVSAIYGFFFVVLKVLLQVMDEFHLLLMRLLLTAVIVGLAEIFWNKTRFQSRQDLFKVMGLGILGVLMVQGFIIFGVHRTTVFHSSLLMSTIPLMTLGMGMILGRESFHVQKILGIGIAFLGVALLLALKHPGVQLPDTYIMGDVIILLNALAFSWFLIGSQTMLKKYGSFSLMSYYYLTSGAVMLLAYLGTNGFGTGDLSFAFVNKLQPTYWWWLGYVVVFASIITYTFNNHALRYTSPSTVSTYIFIQPVVSALMGHYWLNEPFTADMALSGVLTVVGVMLATMCSSRPIPVTEEVAVKLPMEKPKETVVSSADKK